MPRKFMTAINAAITARCRPHIKFFKVVHAKISQNNKLASNILGLQAEFDYQAEELLSANGAVLFCRHDGNADNWALMIDDWRLIAVGPDDVRSQYGYFCETEDWGDEAQVEGLVMKWLNSGQAYEDYLSKTHCRYCL